MQLGGSLKLMMMTSAGYDEHNHGGPEVLEGLANAGVMACNNGGTNAIAVAEIAVMLMLMVCKKGVAFANSASEGHWNRGPQVTEGKHPAFSGGRELSKQTVGVIGFGNIGRMVCRLLAGFKCELLYYDVDELMVGRDGELDATAVSLEELLTRSDIVTAHVPNQPSTNGRISGEKLMGPDQFDLMKEDAIYISTCRGPVTDEDALIDALQSGSIYGAGLDVTDPEPADPNNPLLNMENVVVLPHIASIGTPPERGANFVMDNLKRLDVGKPLVAVVNGPGHSDGIFVEEEDAVEALAARL